MPAPLVFAHGPVVYLLRPGTPRPLAYPASARSGSPARPGLDVRPETLPAGLVAELGRVEPGETTTACGAALARAAAERLGRSVARATVAEWRRALASLPEAEPADEWQYVRSVAASDLERALRSPEEVLITLAREEERLERVVGRESRAAESLLSTGAARVSEYQARWTSVRAELGRHHDGLLTSLEAAATEVVPNLSMVVGPRTAARFVAAAGGLASLARMSAGRIQLLGSRRRPDPVRGPRYGLIFRADGMDQVPPARRAALARSLAALSAIAVRSDAITHAATGEQLRRRRDRRISSLRKWSG